MSVVKINALHVPQEASAELERRFAARQRAVEYAPGFEGFQLLRPTAGEDRYFVVTTWASQEHFDEWLQNRAHRDEEPELINQMDLLEFEVVEPAN